MKALCALVLLGCVAAPAQDVGGHYVLVGVHEVGSELLLKPDGTFEYMLAYGAADYSAEGKWRREAGAVVLDTTPVKGPPFRLIRSSAVGEQGGVRVWLKGPGGDPVPNIDVAVQTSEGKLRGRTSDRGNAFFANAQKPSSVSFEVHVYSLNAGPYAVDSAQNDFTFEINGPAITTVPFKDERLKISGANLELRFWDRDKAMIYEKQ